jgi:hypothetical protein
MPNYGIMGAIDYIVKFSSKGEMVGNFLEI